MSSAGSRPARIEWALSIKTPERAGVDRLVGHADHVADRGQIRLVHRLVGLCLAQHADLLVVLEDRVPGFDDPRDGGLGALGLADVRPFTGQPQHVVLAADLAGDVDTAASAIERILAVARVVGRERAVDRPRIFPEPRRDDLDEEPLAVENLLDLRDPFLGAGPVQIGRHDVIVVKLDGVKSQLLVCLQLLRELHLLADGRPERVGTRADVPGTE